jgi:hypothetical protein
MAPELAEHHRLRSNIVTTTVSQAQEDTQTSLVSNRDI